jgi:hypothetical protein
MKMLRPSPIIKYVHNCRRGRNEKEIDVVV